MVQGTHEIQFECVMSNVVLGTTTGDIVFDVEWYITKSGRSVKVFEETTDGPIVVGQSVLLAYKGLNVYVSKA